jgi:hypothetical protein
LRHPVPPEFTLKDIENLVSSGRAKLLAFEDFAIVNYVSNMSSILAASMPPVYIDDRYGEVMKNIQKHNGIFIDAESVVLNELTKIEPELCKNYVYETFDDWTRIPSALIMRKERRNMLESMNVIVAERMSFVDNYVQSLTLNEKCREHLFPVYTSNPSYSSLKLAKLSGTFVFLFLFLCLAFLIFVGELLFVWWRPRVRTFHKIILFSTTLSPDVQRLILEKCAKIQEIIES